MGFNNTLVIVGNVTRDPEIRQTSGGNAMTTLAVAWNNRYMRNGERVEEAHFFDVVCFGQLAENVSESVTRGMRVVVYGRLNQRKWETETGEQRQKVEITAEDVCPSLCWATASVARNPYPGGNEAGGYRPRGTPAGTGSGAARGSQPPVYEPPASAESESWDGGASGSYAPADEDPF